MAGQQEKLKPEVIDAPLLKVPFESLKRAAKERKALVDEAGEALASLSTSTGGAASKEQQLQQIDQLVSCLQGLKRKLGDVSQQEAGDALRCKARLEHLQQLGAPGKGSVVAWNKQRLDRLLVDHMLRSGNQASAGEGFHVLTYVRYTAWQPAAETCTSNVAAVECFKQRKCVAVADA
jgi:hypothetical protein